MKRVLLFGLLANLMVMVKADTGRQNVLLEYHNPGAYTVKARLGGDTIRDFLFDTGSSLVVLSPEAFRALTRDVELLTVRTIRGAMADGKIVRTDVFEIPQLIINESCTLYDVEAVVLPGAQRNILGLSALNQLGVISMAFEPPALAFTACGDILPDP